MTFMETTLHLLPKRGAILVKLSLSQYKSVLWSFWCVWARLLLATERVRPTRDSQTGGTLRMCAGGPGRIDRGWGAQGAWPRGRRRRQRRPHSPAMEARLAAVPSGMLAAAAAAASRRRPRGRQRRAPPLQRVHRGCAAPTHAPQRRMRTSAILTTATAHANPQCARPRSRHSLSGPDPKWLSRQHAQLILFATFLAYVIRKILTNAIFLFKSDIMISGLVFLVRSFIREQLKNISWLYF